MEILKTANKGWGKKESSGRCALAAKTLRRGSLQIGNSEREVLKAYSDPINFYNEPPSYSITLQEFEQYATERLKMLRVIERVNSITVEVQDPSSRDQKLVRYTLEYYAKILQNIKEAELPTYYLMFTNTDEFVEERALARRVDHIAHFLLRLAFARTDEQRKWFISMEVDFLRFKLSMLNKNLTTVLKKHNMPFEEISLKEKEKFQTNIYLASLHLVDTQHPAGDLASVYKVHFTQAIELVRARKVFLHKGFAYVPIAEFAGVIAMKFRSYLSESLSILKKNIHLIEDDERLSPFINGFEKRHLGSAPTIKSGDAVSASQLPSFSVKSFPLCMKHLFDVVEKDHHLKHWGRLQLGLFFKGLGLPLDEAVKFWQTNFTKRPEIDSGRFEKQYLYNIRHMYGQEGKRAGYTPYSCMKIINSSVGPGDHHGCPFRHSDPTPLRVKLVDAGIAQDGVKLIMKLVEDKHYQLACQKYFELTHDGFTVDGGVNHPNQYFLESRSVLTGKKTIKSESDKVKSQVKRTVIYSQKGQSQSQSTASSTSEEPMELDEADPFAKDPMSEEMLSAMDMIGY